MIVIQRIENPVDCPQANPHYVEIHNAYLINDTPVYFEIKNKTKAVLHSSITSFPEELIQAFRFYNYQVTEFYDDCGNLLFSYKAVPLTQTDIISLQPSQFYISDSKLEACCKWVRSKDDLMIPVYPDTKLICDGHTRLYAAIKKGITQCYTYPAVGVDRYILDFVRMAQERNIYQVSDMQLVSKEEYQVVWNQFCDDFFSHQITQSESPHED